MRYFNLDQQKVTSRDLEEHLEMVHEFKFGNNMGDSIVVDGKTILKDLSKKIGKDDRVEWKHLPETSSVTEQIAKINCLPIKKMDENLKAFRLIQDELV